MDTKEQARDVIAAVEVEIGGIPGGFVIGTETAATILAALAEAGLVIMRMERRDDGSLITEWFTLPPIPTSPASPAPEAARDAAVPATDRGWQDDIDTAPEDILGWDDVFGLYECSRAAGNGRWFDAYQSDTERSPTHWRVRIAPPHPRQ